MKNTTNATSPLANSYDIKSYKRKIIKKTIPLILKCNFYER